MEMAGAERKARMRGSVFSRLASSSAAVWNSTAVLAPPLRCASVSSVSA
jgi:hypothetical protein